MVCENLNQAKALAHQHHVFAELSLPSEISAMRVAPKSEAAVALAFVMGEGGIDFAVTAIGHFQRFDHAARHSASVAHNPALAGCRGVGLVLRAAGRGLDALEHKPEQFVGKLRAVAERER